MEHDTVPPTRVMALHALAYCERLFYLEEVEEIRVADEAVYEGRALHATLEDGEGEGCFESHVLESERLGIRGKVDCLRRRDGALIPYEHKKGRSRKGTGGPEPWPSDRLQALAYGLLVRECLEGPVQEVRIRYHADNALVTLPVGEEAEREVAEAVARGNALRNSLERPPVASNEALCVRCSLAPVCLPEEERLAEDPHWDTIRLFPPDPEKASLHVVTPGAKVGRSAESLRVTLPGGEKSDHPSETIEAVILHGYSHISTQALGLCASKGIGVHWVTGGGRYLGGFASGSGGVQRKIRQFRALSSEGTCLDLARKLVRGKVTAQVRFLLRATRGARRDRSDLEDPILEMRAALSAIDRAKGPEELRGYEGGAGHAYFRALPHLILPEVPAGLRPKGRSRRPPLDPFNAVLSFNYALLYRDVLSAILTIGLEPAFGFLHRPRSSAHPLALDLMELFRVPIVDMAVLASFNRLQWNEREDFVRTGKKVWLSDSGRRKAVEIHERRLEERWKHPATGYSLSYARLIELEGRLLEKEWTGRPGLFARMALR